MKYTSFFLVLVVGYLLGIKFPGIAARFGLTG